jgi:hypothetical protein
LALSAAHSEPYRNASWAPLSESGGKTIGRTLVILLLLSALAALPSPTAAGGAPPAEVRELAGTESARQRARRDAARRYLTLRIARADARGRYWLRLMHRPLPPRPRLKGLALTELVRAAERQVQRAAALAQVARHPPHLAVWHCIQRHETAPPYPSWRTDSGNGYYGGLQFDRQFQVTYGSWLYRSKGTADNWTRLEQIWTAELAHASGRGFHPWPHTARACGVL